jgi:hypothetical protein
MKKNCWEILGIPRTKDSTIIKKAYRDLIKKYHPDTVQAPERKRKYTIKCVEINRAYEDAMKYMETHQHDREAMLGTDLKAQASPAQRRKGVFVWAFGTFILLVFISPVLFFFIELLNIYPAFTRTMNFIFTYYKSMPLEGPLKMIISFPLALILGALCNGVLSIFTTVPVLFLWGALSDTKHEEYMYKLGYVIITALNFTIVYFIANLHWPFEHRANDYYNFLYHLCRFLSWSYVPIIMLVEWITDNMKYLRVKHSLKSGGLVLHQQD